MRRTLAAAALSFVTLAPATAGAATINVPADQPTIQAAINAAAASGDEVVISANTYTEAIDFMGKAVTVRGATGDPADVIIDGDGALHVVTFNSMEGPGSVLQDVTITGGDAMGSPPDSRGGGMYIEGSSPTVTNCVFTMNTAVRGGAIFVDGGSPDVTGCTFDSNDADLHGGGVYLLNLSSAVFTDCVFTANTSTGDGGGLLINNSDAIVTGGTFTGNSADRGGGMFNGGSSSPTVTNCSFSGNTASNGGGMSNNTSSSPTVSNCTFTGNTASGTGGGMVNNTSSSPMVTDCTFSGNMATTGNGGGMANQGASSPTVTGCTFDTNSAGGLGGGMLNSVGSNPDVDNCMFSGNSAGDRGGGMFNQEASPTLTDCTFTGNTTDGAGGGIHDNANSDSTVTNCTFTGNTAGTDGGGMFSVNNSDPVVTGCTFEGNTATTGLGGGLSLKSGTGTITDCVFLGNTSVLNGGGIQIFNADPLVERCSFLGNECTGFGGGVYHSYNVAGAGATFVNCLFSGNTNMGNSDEGGAFFHNTNSGVTATFVNCTMAGNEGGIRNAGALITLANCVLEGNGPIEIVAFSPVSASHCTIEGGLPANVTDAGGNFDADPLFVDADGADDIVGTLDDDLRLGADSPAVDAGDDAAVMGVATDLDGNPRIQSCRVDLGAYESAQLDADGDGDGIPTCVEGNVDGPDGDSIPNHVDDDSDGDGIPDATEGAADGPDGDMIPNYLDDDSDGDGILDATEGAGDPDGDMIPSYLDDDSDGDGILDMIEGAGDGDADGVADFLDICPGTPPQVAVDASGCATMTGITNLATGFFYDTVQAAIDQAQLGEIIELQAGTYSVTQTIDFLGKAITVRGATGDPADVILDGGGAVRVIRCDSGEGPGTVLEGVTVTGGDATGGGGMYNDGSSPTVTNCTFTGNSASQGGGMANESGSPMVTNCTFNGNSAVNGGGMYNLGGSPTVTNCTFSGNSADFSGGGMYNDSSSPTVTNCTLSGNSAGFSGGGMDNSNSNPTVTNCILRGNTPDELSGSGFTVTYSNVQGGFAGTGNIDADPLFVDADGADDVAGTLDDDLRLGAWSPCTDAGDSAAAIAGGFLDLDRNPRFVDDAGVPDTGAGGSPIVDMGAYERQDDSPPTINVPADFLAIQPAIDAASDGMEVIVAPGTYPVTQTIDLLGKAITLRGATGDPADAIIDGGGAARVIQCVSGEGPGTVLQGVTITGGVAGFAEDFVGGGMFNAGSSPTVIDCTFSGNMASEGAGMFNSNSDLTVTNCTFSGNMAGVTGGGMRNDASDPTVTGCTFSGNTAQRGGGMSNFFSSNPTVIGCTFSSNVTTGEGGGVFHDAGNLTVINSVFDRNECSDNDFGGGGMVLYGPGISTVTSCTFSGNVTNGGGSAGAILVFDVLTYVNNCAIWGNAPDQILDVAGTLIVNDNTIQGGYGPNNIDADPLFVDAAGGDLRLLAGSPCIDAGNDAEVPGGIVTDIDGNDRLVDGDLDFTPTVDMGAHEFQPVGANDTCGNAQTLALDTPEVFSTAGATSDGPDEDCGSGVEAIERDVWFRYFSACDATLEVTVTGAFDAQVVVYGSSCPAASGTALACDENLDGGDAVATLPVTSGQLYRIRVGGAAGAGGTAMITLGCVAPPCPGDTDGSGVVDIDDIVNVVLDFGTDGSANGGDVDGSGVVDIDDIVFVVLNFGDVCF